MGSQALGFYDLMNIAEQNTEQSERDASKLKFPSYKASKNKKEDPKSKALSDNVRKFLEKKEEERRKVEEQERQKREHLINMRSKDKKSKKRVNQMLRMTKSSNKSAMADAVNCLNDSLVDQHSELQPDEDDYGYVSQASQEWHKKLIEQYKTIKKSAPVPASKLHNVPVPEVKSIKSSSGSTSQTQSQPQNGAESSLSRRKDTKLKKPPLSSLLSYHDLLALANEVKDAPEASIIEVPKKKHEEEFEFGRPMTAKEKSDYLSEKGLRERVAKQIENGTFRLKAGPSNKDEKSKDSGISNKSVSFKIPSKKLSTTSIAPSIPPPKATASGPRVESQGERIRKESVHEGKDTFSKSDPRESYTKSDRRESFSERNNDKRKPETVTRPPPKARIDPSNSERSVKLPPPYMDSIQQKRNIVDNSPERKGRNPEPPSRNNGNLSSNKSLPVGNFPKKPERLENTTPIITKTKPLPDRIHNENRQQPPNGRPRNQGQKNTLNDERKWFEERKQPKFDDRNNNLSKHGRGQPSQERRLPKHENSRSPEFENRRKPGDHEPSSSKLRSKGRLVVESDEEEYDSEMDDFIDDSECDPNAISAMIRQITGYDKRRYHPEDEGECKETSAYDQMREESRSLRIGIQEDLEDMRLEQEEKKRKTQQKSSPAKKKPRL